MKDCNNESAGRTAPTLEALEPRLMLDADPAVVRDGLGEFLGVFADAMDENILAAQIPLVGDALEGSVDFLREMETSLDDAYAALDADEDPANPTPGNEFVQKMLFEAWHVDKNLLVDDNSDPITVWQDVGLEETAAQVQFNCHLYVDIYSYTDQFDIDESVDFDIGFDILSVDVSGEVFFSVGFDWQLNFGQLKDSGTPTDFYVDTDATVRPGAQGEMEFTAEAAIPDLQASGNFLHLGALVADEDADDDDTNNGTDVDGDGLLPSQLKAVFAIDVVDVNDDNHLTQAEIAGAEATDLVDAHAYGGLHRDIFGYADVADYCLVDINLHIDLNYGGIEETLSLGDEDTGGMQLPHVSADFRLAWFVFDNEMMYDTDAGRFDFGPDPLDRFPVVEFNHISLNLGQFISKFAGPVLNGYQIVTAPSRQLLEWFNTPIPVISEIAGDDTLTLAKIACFIPKIGPIIDVANRLGQAVQFAEAFPEGADIAFDFGYFKLGGDLRQMNELKDDLENILNEANGLLDFLPLGLGDQITQEIYDFLSENAQPESYEYGLRFPILMDPGEIVKFMLGGDASLIEFVFPGLEIDFSYDQSFPIFPPFLNVGFSGDIETGLRLGLGFDTYGLRRFAETENPTDIFNGFYIKDTWLNDVGVEEDLPEMYLDLTIGASAFAGIPGLIEGGARGGISADIGIDFHDIDGDGRVRFTELQQRAAQGWHCIFDASGSLSAFLEAYVWVGLDLGPLGTITAYEDSWSIAEGEIFNFNWSCPENNFPPELATLVAADSAIAANGNIVPVGTAGARFLPGGTLALNMGPRADNRGDSGFGGCTLDKNESFVVSQETVETSEGVFQEMIVVRALGFEQYFDPALVDYMYAEGGSGNDTIRILDSVTTTGTNGQIVTATLYGDFRGDTDDGAEATTDGNADDGIDNEDKLYLGVGGGNLYGGDGSDQLHGGDGANYIYGGSGDDTLQGGDGDDYMEGGSNQDTLRGYEGDDQLHGGAQADRIYGHSGDDELYGDAGKDVLSGSSGDDVMHGGDGDDRILGGGGDDELYGNAGADVIDGSSGTDELWGGWGADTLTGGSGNDTLDGGAGNDAMYGGTGNDTLSAGDGDDYVEGNVGDDILDGGAGNDRLIGGSSSVEEGTDDGADTLYGRGGMDILLGDDGTIGSVILLGGGGSDTMYGGAGSDEMYGQGGDDYMEGGADDDTMYGNAGDDTMNGGDGSDYMEGNANADTINGDGGADEMYGHAGDDTMNGGAGNDYMEGNTGADTINGDGGADEMYGNAGDDTMSGGDGDDYMEGNAGSDTMYGGADNDTMIGGSSSGGTDNSADTMHGDDGDDVMLGDDGAIGSVILLGGAGSDTMYGGAGNDDIYGQGGDDAMYGGAGEDYMEGNAGNDEMYGGDDNDRMIGGSSNPQATDGDDTMYGGDGDDILLGDDGAIDALGNVTPLGGAGNDWISGGAGNDRIYGQGGNDTLLGDDGDDTIYGNDGMDHMIGGLGADTMYGGAGSDAMLGDLGTIVSELLDGSTADVLRAQGHKVIAAVGAAGTYRHHITLTDPGIGGNDVMYGGEGDDAMHGGAGADEIHGGAGNDALFGNAGNDRIFGNGGSDHLYGGTGDDLLDGGTDADISYGGDGQDTLIADVREDRLIDWLGNFNEFILSWGGPRGHTIVRSPAPQMRQFLIELATADGAEEPADEIALVELPSPGNAGRGKGK